MRIGKFLLALVPVLGLTGFAPRPSAPHLPPGSHTWDFTEIFSNADGTIQFLELRECCGGAGETGPPGHLISSSTKSCAPTPDAIIPAGTLPYFFSVFGDSLTYAPWDTWNFGAVPCDGINSLKRNGTVSPNDPTNYAGVSGSVSATVGVPSMGSSMVILLAVLSVLAISAILIRRPS